MKRPLLAELIRLRPAVWAAATGTGGQFNRNMRLGRNQFHRPYTKIDLLTD